MIDFEPADPPRAGHLVFPGADGPQRVPVGEALPRLLRDDRDGYWGAAAERALRLIADGRLVPGISPGGFDAWRIDAPPPGEERLRLFFDAIADTLPRTPAAPLVAGGPAYAAPGVGQAPGLREWLDSAVRVSLRLDLDADMAIRVVVQVHSLSDPTQVTEQLTGAALLALRRAAAVWPVLERLLDGSTTRGEDVLTDDEVRDLLSGAAARLAEAGVEVHWPQGLARDLTATAVIGRDSTGTAPLLDGVLDARWQLALGGGPLTDAEMDLLAAAHRPVVRLRDRWVLVDPDLAGRAAERELKPLSGLEGLAAALSGTTVVDGQRAEVAAEGWVAAVRDRIADPDNGTGPVRPPAALAATLRDYQLRGLRWLERMTGLGLGCCLADDMGLGKTITLIAFHLHRAAGPTLVVCPASLLGNWEREINRFAPGTPVRRFHGPDRSLHGVRTGFVLTTYGTMRLDAGLLAAHHWDLVVADEAQHVKNPASGTAKALRTIPATARVALTGTPVENNLAELWAILDWATPGLLGPLAAFRARWAGEPGRLARLVRPFLLRRRKSDPAVAPELPAKTETDLPVALTAEQAGLYAATVRETMARVRQADGMARRGLVLTLLTSLKQICNHPAQFLKEADPVTAGRSGKLDLLDDLLDTILAGDGAVLVFTQYVAMARLVQRHLTARGVPVQLLHGGTPVARREELVRRFQDGRVPVFLLSLKAAGTGLNLTRADHVVHYDRWWNPAVEDQATDRAYRIGQTRPVQVHRLIAEGTLEDRVAGLLAAKRDLADAVLGTGETALTELTDAELAELVDLRSTP